MLIFLGDSFTWGQGLQIPVWIKNGKTTEEITNLMPPHYPAELYDYEGDEYRKKHHFPNLVAKHFNKSYSTKWGNGGSNSQIQFLMEECGVLMDTSGIEAFIVQFTEVSRDYNLITSFYESEELEDDNYPSLYIKKMLNDFDNRFSCVHPNIKWFGFSWRDDIGKVLEKDYSENFIPIHYDDKIYNSFEPIRPKLDLAYRYNIPDGHFNSDGHRVIAKSIIKKITPYL